MHPLHGRSIHSCGGLVHLPALRPEGRAACQQNWRAAGLSHRQLQRQPRCMPAPRQGARACLSSSVRVRVLPLHAPPLAVNMDIKRTPLPHLPGYSVQEVLSSAAMASPGMPAGILVNSSVFILGIQILLKGAQDYSAAVIAVNAELVGTLMPLGACLQLHILPHASCALTHSEAAECF